MARVTEITVTYSRKNQPVAYQNEEVFLAIKFQPETGDNIDDLIHAQFMRCLEQVDKHSGKDAPVIVRRFTVTDQNGDTIGPSVKDDAEKNSGGKSQPSEAPKDKQTTATPPQKPPVPANGSKGASTKLEKLTADQMRREIKAWLDKNPRMEFVPSWLYGSDAIIAEAYDQMKKHGIMGWNEYIAELEKKYPKEV